MIKRLAPMDRYGLMFFGIVCVVGLVLSASAVYGILQGKGVIAAPLAADPPLAPLREVGQHRLSVWELDSGVRCYYYNGSLSCLRVAP